MAAYRIEQFKGLIPRSDPSLLPDGCAIVANNLLLKNGKIVPIKSPSLSSFSVYLENGLTSLSNAQTIYPWHRTVSGNDVVTILAWPGVVSVAHSNISDDDRDRLFVSGSTGIPHVQGVTNNNPSVYFNNRYNGTVCRRTLIKSKLPAITASVVETEVEEYTGVKRNTFFYQTWVDKYGYESPVSDSSNEIEYYNGQTISISAVSSHDSQAVARRIYKTITGDATAENRFVIEFRGSDPWSAKEFAVKDENVGEAMPMIENPPSDMRGIVYVPGGYYAGFSDSMPRTVHFSDVSMPYSWPTAYKYDIHDDIVGLATSKNTVFVLTKNRVWILRGTDPESMVASALSPAACVSQQSIVEYNNNVFFASNFGYCVVHNTATDGDVVTNMTDKLFTKEQWKALNPSSCKSVIVDGRIMSFFTVGTETKCFIFDINETDCMLTTHDCAAKCACVDAESDTMYFVSKN